MAGLAARRPPRPKAPARAAAPERSARDDVVSAIERATALSGPVTERHLEILRVALGLFGERGYGGASLRELARRLGIAQPSLYHWFDSKEQLVEQIVTHLGPTLLVGSAPPDPPREIVEVPRWAVTAVLALWDDPGYVDFVRFLFSDAAKMPHVRAAVTKLYRDGLVVGTRAVFGPFLARGEIDETEAMAIMRTAVNGIGLLLIEERLLYGRSRPSSATKLYAEALVSLLEDAIRARGTKGRSSSRP